jgi:hypothetical protein
LLHKILGKEGVMMGQTQWDLASRAPQATALQKKYDAIENFKKWLIEFTPKSDTDYTNFNEQRRICIDAILDASKPGTSERNAEIGKRLNEIERAIPLWQSQEPSHEKDENIERLQTEKRKLLKNAEILKQLKTDAEKLITSQIHGVEDCTQGELMNGIAKIKQAYGVERALTQFGETQSGHSGLTVASITAQFKGLPQPTQRQQPAVGSTRVFDFGALFESGTTRGMSGRHQGG